MEYTIELTMQGRKALTEETLAQVAEISGAAGGRAGEDRLTTTLTTSGKSLEAALQTAIGKVVAIYDGHVIHAGVTVVDEFDRLAEENKNRARLAGTAEVAELLGVSRTRVSQILRDRDDAPRPLELLASGPVWRLADWSTFKEGWQRKGGRPRKIVQEEAVA